VQQLVQDRYPGITHWWGNVAVSLPIVLCLAMFSWHVVEKPSLALRHALRDKPQAVKQQPALVVFCIFAAIILYGRYMASTSHVIEAPLSSLLADPVVLAEYADLVVLLALAGTISRLGLFPHLAGRLGELASRALTLADGTIRKVVLR
jgi:peptidoglycan/LPS O-acetylase OafA/YrhL